MQLRTARTRLRNADAADLAIWLLIACTGLALTALADYAGARLGTASAPFVGHYRVEVDLESLLAPMVAGCVLIAAARGTLQRLSWRSVLAVGYVGTVAWALALALVEGVDGLTQSVNNRDEYLPDAAGIGHHVGEFLDTFVRDSAGHTIATRQHPPGPVLALWGLDRLGIDRAPVLGLLITALGCLTVPLVLVAIRSLCGEAAARRLTPVLILAPYAIWVAVSMDAITATLSAAMVTAGVLASEHHRRGPSAVLLAALGGLLLGASALMSYAAPWMALTVICVYFVRRRPLLIVVTGAAALMPLLLVQGAGFVWTDGLTAAQADFSLRDEPQRSAVVWGLVSLVVLALACGPAIVASARKIRRTPGWPFLVGAAVAVGFAVGAGLARGEMEHAWLPFFPWLLVAAVAPERGGRVMSDPPVLLAAGGAVGAILLAAILQTSW